MLEWLSTEMKTGHPIIDLPLLAAANGSDLTVAVQMGAYQAVAAVLPLPKAPTEWPRATKAGAATLVLLQDSLPIWGGFVVKATPDETDELPISLATLEAYFDRVYIGDETFTTMGMNDIISYLMTTYIVPAGLPIRTQVDSGGSGTAITVSYLSTDNKTIYTVMQELSARQSGPEWTVGWEHLTSPERYTPVLHVASRLGTAAAPGMSPSAVFEMPGPVTKFQAPTDYSAGKGANRVVAYSSGQGANQPVSSVQTVSDADRPSFEYRWTPSTSISDVGTLTTYAASKLTLIENGTTSISLSAVADDAPKVGSDWVVGDDIGYDIGGLDQNGEDLVPSVPGGLVGVARAIGWQMTVSNLPIITPVLA
jgi:hypothetical protein